MNLFRRFCALFRRGKLDAEMSEEMRAHLELQAAENEKRGMSADEARYAAHRVFGGVEQIKERARDQRGARWLDDLMRDFRFGWRVIAKAPVMSAVIVLSLALGIGANTAGFSWIRTVAFEALPGLHDSSHLAIIEQRNSSGIVTFASPAEWRDLRRQCRAFEDIFAQSITTMTHQAATQDARVWVEAVSGNFFEVLGVRPALGRLLTDRDDEPGRPPVAVVAHKFWQTQLGGRPGVIGETIRLNDRSFTVIGVAPPDFQGFVAALAFDIWIPQGVVWSQEDRKARFFQLVGRRRPGVSLEQADADANRVLARLAEAFPDSNRGVTADVVPRWRSRIGAEAQLVPTVATLQTVELLVLLVVCTNAANLLLAQAATRSKEIAIRLSLGAGRARVVRQLLAESLLLALLGAALGTVLAAWSLDLINHIPKPTNLPVAIAAHLDYRELLYSLVLAFACALGFGLAPALQVTRRSVGAALKAGGHTSAVGGRRRFQEFLVGAEIALTLVIVIMAGLFVKSFRNARLVYPGFNPHGIALASFDLSARDYDAGRARLLSTKLLTRLRESPGVQSAALATWVPLDLIFTQPAEFTFEGQGRKAVADQTLWYETSPGYFATLQIPLLAGRDFSEATQSRFEPEAIVNAEFVRRCLPGNQPALERRLTLRGVTYRVVGVAQNAKYNSLSEAPQPTVYLSFSGEWRSRVTLFARAGGGLTNPFATMKEALHEVDPGVAMLEPRTFDQHLENAMILRAVPAKILSALGPLSVALAAIGLYSVLAYTVARRTHEIGVRMTLGATTRGVTFLMLRQGMIAVLAGLAIGTAGAYGVSMRLSGQLVEVAAGDPWLFTSLPLLLAAVAFFACWLPARRAAKVDPMVALRCE
jgi:predicted permease